MASEEDHSKLLQETLNIVNMYKYEKTKYFTPTEVECILKATEGSDMLGIIPTGHGTSSVVFEAAAIYLSLLRPDSKTIMISRRTQLIDHQIAAHYAKFVVSDDRPISDEYGSDVEIDDYYPDERWHERTQYHNHEIRHGDFKFLVGRPKDFVHKRVMRMLRSVYCDISMIIVDDAQCLVEGTDHFREKYRDIHKLRDCFPNTHVVALTSTALVKTQEEICRMLKMTSVRVVSGQADRANVKYSVSQLPTNYLDSEAYITPVLAAAKEELGSKGAALFPKTVIYSSLDSDDSDEAWDTDGVKISSSGELLDMKYGDFDSFHNPPSAKKKKPDVEGKASEDGEVKIVVSTGIKRTGKYAQDIGRVIHSYPPRTLEDYVQTAGICGRNGIDCEALLFFNEINLASRSVAAEMRDYCHLTSCRRDYLCAVFGIPSAFTGPPHLCCDNCQLHCPCGECPDQTDDIRRFIREETPTAPGIVYSQQDLIYFPAVEENVIVASDAESAIHQGLVIIFRNLRQERGVDFTGLQDPVAQDVSANYKLLTSEEAIQSKYPDVDPEDVKLILQTIDCLKDLDYS